MSKRLSCKVIENYIDFSIYNYYRNNFHLICLDSLIKGIEDMIELIKSKDTYIIQYFNKLKTLKLDKNKDKIDQYFYEAFNWEGILQRKSYLLGLLIGSRYIGVCSCDLKYCMMDILDMHLKWLFKENKDILFDCIEYSNCGNGRCLHIINVIPILKKIITFDDNFKYGSEYDDNEYCTVDNFDDEEEYELYLEENSVFITDFNQDTYNKMLKHTKKFKKDN